MRAFRGIAGGVVVMAGCMTIGSGVARAAGTAASIATVEGQPLTSIVVDTVSPCRSPTSVTNIKIDWGDSTSTDGSATTAGGTCDIIGSHTHAEEGPYATSVSYALSGVSATDTGSATVADAPVTASPAGDVTAQAGAALSGVVANWSDPALEALSSYSATIDWGDGTASAGAIGNPRA